MVQKPIDSLSRSLVDSHADHRRPTHRSRHSSPLHRASDNDGTKILQTFSGHTYASCPPRSPVYIRFSDHVHSDAFHSGPWHHRWHTAATFFHLFLHAPEIPCSQFLASKKPSGLCVVFCSRFVD